MKFTTKNISQFYTFAIIALIVYSITITISHVFDIPYEKMKSFYMISSSFFGYGLGYFVEIKR